MSCLHASKRTSAVFGTASQKISTCDKVDVNVSSNLAQLRDSHLDLAQVCVQCDGLVK